ncbi:hypothetical protein Bca4012_098138 [Brassica carinata]
MAFPPTCLIFHLFDNSLGHHGVSSVGSRLLRHATTLSVLLASPPPAGNVFSLEISFWSKRVFLSSKNGIDIGIETIKIRLDFSDEDESWHKEGGVPRLIVIVPDLWIRKGETNRGLQNLDKEGGGKVYGQFDLIDLSRIMTQGQWMVKSGGKKVQAPSMGLKISIPKFDNSVLITEYSKTLIGRCMNPFKQEMNALLFHLPKIWNVDERVVGADLGLGRFQFDFDQEEDIVEKSTDEETEVQPPKPEQDPAMLSYKGAVESQGRELGGDANGNNRRLGHQVPRNRDYKGKGIAFDNSKYEGNSKSGFKRSNRDQDTGYLRNLRQTGRFPQSEAPMRYAIDTRGLKNINTQEMGKNLDEQQKLMLDAFWSGKSEETNQISDSTARKALSFEGNISGTAMEGLGGTDVASGIAGASVGEEDPKALKEKLLPERHGADKQMDLNKEESEGEKIEEMEGLSEEIDSELTGDVALTETGEQDGSEHVGDEVFAEADFDVEEDDQLMETETQEVLIESEGKERGRANKKKQGKVNGAAMGGSLKKRLVQSVVSPRKKHTVKKGSKVGEKDALPPEKAPVKHVPNQI